MKISYGKNVYGREEIKAVANKYLNPNQRLVLEYLPESSKK